MRRHLILFFSALFLLVACIEEDKPADIINKDKMVKILLDVHLVDGSLMVFGAKDTIYKYATNRYGLLFKKHGVDSATFKKSVKYYAGKPDELVKMYDEVADILKAKKDSVSKLQSKFVAREARKRAAKNKADSLKRDSIKARSNKADSLKRGLLTKPKNLKTKLRKRIL